MFQSFTGPNQGGDGAGRLASLRAAMAAAGLSGWIAPRADAHQGEYVAPRDERLAWLTGFTGSAGIAIALPERAAVFVDGRYTLQASQQVDGAAFEVTPIHEVSPEDWLKSAAKGLVIGFDPWLHGGAEVERLTKAVEAVGGALKPLDGNLIDAIWDDQPPPPAAAIRVHPTEYAGKSGAEKRAAIAADLTERGAAAAVLTLPDSIAWLFNIRGGDIPRNPVPLVFAIIRDDGAATLFAEAEQVDGALLAHLGDAVQVEPREAFAAALGGFAKKTVWIDPATCPVAIGTALKAGGAKLLRRRDPCVLPKAQKTKAELSGARAAHRRDGAAVARFLRWLDRKGPKGKLTEIDIARRLEAERRATNQLLDISFDTISGSGPNAAHPHYRVSEQSNRKLSPGELMLVDSGGQYRDGTTDITRTMACGAPPAKAVRAFTLVLKGMISLSTIRFPKGVAGRDLDALARAALWREGLDYDHGTGHGIGSYLCVHEGPQRIARTGMEPLKPGMILSNEPGFYLEGEFGIRIENLLIVTEPEARAPGERAMMGFETLTLAPIDRRLIDLALMTAEEIAWLDAYHARVLAEIGPEVGPKTRAWLETVCAPLAADA